MGNWVALEEVEKIVELRDKRIAELETRVSILLRDTRELLTNMDLNVAFLAKLRKEKDKRISELEAALREIAEHPHCYWFDNPLLRDTEKDCGCGSIEGHRCAAEIARKALEGK